jgi:hypothetical protein
MFGRSIVSALACVLALCACLAMADAAFAAAPEAATGAATGVTLTSGTMNGTVNPNGTALASCQFEYGEGELGAAFEHSVPCAPTAAEIGAATTPVAVSADLSGLNTDTPYHYQLVVANTAAEEVTSNETVFATVEPVFGFELAGPYAPKMLVSYKASMSEPSAGSASELDAQAGSHPFDVTSIFAINMESDQNLPSNLEPKDYYVNVPAGFAGSVAKIPRCKMSELSLLVNRQSPRGCPTASQVGVIRVFKGQEEGLAKSPFFSNLYPVYNMVPPSGAPAELAFPYLEVAEPIVFQVRSDSDYGITAKIPNISEGAQLVGSQLTLWGVPANREHDAERFLPKEGKGIGKPGTKEGKPLSAGTPEVPFLTNPTRCGAQPEAMITMDTWLHPGQLAEDGLPIVGGENWLSVNIPMFPGGISGCGALTFRPEIEVKPTTTVADSPTGLMIDLKVPQSENPHNLATPALKTAKVTLPAGLSISPSQANGLEGCTPAQLGLHLMTQPSCSNGSEIGNLELVTPLLPEPLHGEVYISSEHTGNIFHIYFVVEGQGVIVKLSGTAVANEQTGQIETTFEENPQLPFSELKLTLYGGQDAALATPTGCASQYSTTSLLEPWSHVPAPGEAQGTPNATPESSFAITSGCGLGFAPKFKAGTTNAAAGAFSPFTLMISREDGEQELSGVQVKLPEGLVGKLAGIPECSNAQITAAEHNSGTVEKSSSSCPAASQIGTVQAGAGPGEDPFYVSGKAYLTGPYKGAPYGVAVVVPALAGPFDLGTVVVRAAINIDPHTAQVTVTSDSLPRMLDGVPLRTRRILVSINRPDFTLNPTSCEPMQVAGTLSSFEGAQHDASAGFQASDCASLKFKPGFSVYTHAKHTRRYGEYLRVKVTSGNGQANIKSVFVELPKALPSRVETLKLACSAKQFNENPAGCPADSHVGTAVARTPILSTPLMGPAIFVSHGGAAFPDLDVVLQGSGITVELTGNTNIIKGITSSNFKTVPDVPVNSFELKLPAGPHSALAANGNFCYKTIKSHKTKIKRRVKLTMPTTIMGQNGMVVKQATHIVVEGCGKAKH